MQGISWSYMFCSWCGLLVEGKSEVLVMVPWLHLWLHISTSVILFFFGAHPRFISGFGGWVYASVALTLWSRKSLHPCPLICWVQSLFTVYVLFDTGWPLLDLAWLWPVALLCPALCFCLWPWQHQGVKCGEIRTLVLNPLRIMELQVQRYRTECFSTGHVRFRAAGSSRNQRSLPFIGEIRAAGNGSDSSSWRIRWKTKANVKWKSFERQQVK